MSKLTDARRRRRLIQSLKRKQGDRCYYCRVRMTASAPPGEPRPPTMRTVDHVVPLAAGGTNEAGNLVLACNRCNREKGDLDARTFLASRRSAPKRMEARA